MIKKTLYFGNPAYLSLRNGQLVVKLPEVENNPALPEGMKRRSEVTVAVEDIGGGRAGQQADHADFGRHGGADRKQLCPHRVRQPEHARGADDAARREYYAKRAFPPADRRFPAAAQTALAADGAGQDRQPGGRIGRVPRGRRGALHAYLGFRGAERRRGQSGRPRGGLLLAAAFPGRGGLYARPGGHAAQQFAELRLCHPACRRGPGLGGDRPAAHAGHPPPGAATMPTAWPTT